MTLPVFTLRSTQFSFEYGLWWPVTLQISPGVRHVDISKGTASSKQWFTISFFISIVSKISFLTFYGHTNLAPKFIYVFSCDQAALRTAISVCLSVCPSVTPFWQWSCHPIIIKFSGVITYDRSDVLAKGQGQRSKVKVTKVKKKSSNLTQIGRFRTVTPVWIHQWLRNDEQSLK